MVRTSGRKRGLRPRTPASRGARAPRDSLTRLTRAVGAPGGEEKKGEERGNTSSRSYSYNFTLYPAVQEGLPAQDMADIMADISQKVRDHVRASRAKYWCWQHELCPTTKRDHLQGVIGYPTQRRWAATVGNFTLAGCKPPHIEVTKDVLGSKDYCSKDASWVVDSVRECGGVWPRRVASVVQQRVRPVRDPLEGKVLRPWQQRVVDIVRDYKLVDDRTLHWFVDEAGAAGKSSLCKHLMLKYGSDGLYASGGKAGDIAFLVNAFVKGGGDLKWFLFDFPRSSEGRVSYKAMEEILNGMCFSPKFESAFCMFNVCHVIVFANWEPDRSALSLDRWRVHHIRALPNACRPAIPDNPRSLGLEEEFVQVVPRTIRSPRPRSAGRGRRP